MNWEVQLKTSIYVEALRWRSRSILGLDMHTCIKKTGLKVAVPLMGPVLAITDRRRCVQALVFDNPADTFRVRYARSCSLLYATSAVATLRLPVLTLLCSKAYSYLSALFVTPELADHLCG